MSRIPAKKSRKMFAPRIASPLTSPRYCAIFRPSIKSVVTTSMTAPRLEHPRPRPRRSTTRSRGSCSARGRATSGAAPAARCRAARRGVSVLAVGCAGGGRMRRGVPVGTGAAGAGTRSIRARSGGGGVLGGGGEAGDACDPLLEVVHQGAGLVEAPGDLRGALVEVLAQPAQLLAEAEEAGRVVGVQGRVVVVGPGVRAEAGEEVRGAPERGLGVAQQLGGERGLLAHHRSPLSSRRRATSRAIVGES